MLIYALLHLTGYARPTIDDIRNFRQLHSPCAGHPENFELPGVECTTGPLGQGLAMAVGMAMAERHLNAVFGDDLVDHRTWVIAGDGCLMEGINHEAIGLGRHLKLGRLNVLWDDNRITIDGDTLSTSEDIKARYAATGWHVAKSATGMTLPISAARWTRPADPRPSLVACRTVIGKGAPNKQGTHNVHGSPLGADEDRRGARELGWDHAAVSKFPPMSGDWRAPQARGARKPARNGKRALPTSAQRPSSSAAWQASSARGDEGMNAYIDGLLANPQKVATRKASRNGAGSDDAAFPKWSAARRTLPAQTTPRPRRRRPSKAVRLFGPLRLLRHPRIRHGRRDERHGAARRRHSLWRHLPGLLGLLPQRDPPVRAPAAAVVYVMTHDSIGLGEDGPTHQPVEHVMSLRMIPNLEVFRPCDAIETAECWALALKRSTPSVLALTRQNLPQLRTDGENAERQGRLSPARCSRRAQGGDRRDRLGSRDRGQDAPRRSKPRGSALTSSRCRAGSGSCAAGRAYRGHPAPMC
jgi:transketolase